MAKIIRDVHLGDHTISLKETDEGHLVARLSSIGQGGILEIEKLNDDSLRIRDLDIGSATVETEHLALLLVLVKADKNVRDELHKIYEAREDFTQ